MTLSAKWCLEERHCPFPGDILMQLHVLRNCKHRRNNATTSAPPPFTAAFLNVKITTVLSDVLCKLPFSILPKAARPLARPSGASSSPLLASFANCGIQKSQDIQQMSTDLCIIFIIHKRQYQKIGKIVTFAF